jgi:RNA polymerase sigma-70 factor, ECF subfamily
MNVPATLTPTSSLYFPSNLGEFQKALSALVPSLRAKALRLTRADAKADDLVQDTVVRALTFAKQYAFGTNVRAWVSQILFSVFVSRYRKEKREVLALKIRFSRPKWARA